MPAVQKVKTKGCKKCGRSSRKGRDENLSAFVRNRISAEEYFKKTSQSFKK